MAQMASESLVDAVVTRIRQIAPISTAWGPSSAYEAIKIVQGGDLAYLPERLEMVDDLPAVFVNVDGPVDLEIVGLNAPEFQATYSIRCIYIDNYSRVTDEPWTMVRNRVDVLADAFMDSAVLNGVSTTLTTLLSAVTSKVEYSTPEEGLLQALGLEDIFCGAWTVTITGLSTGS